MRTALVTFFTILATVAAPAIEMKPPLPEFLAQADLVMVGKLTKVREWTVDDIDHGEGIIEVS